MRRTAAIRLSRRGLIAGAFASAGLMVRPFALHAETLRPKDIRALAFDGRSLILAADGFWRSDDGGTSWSFLAEAGYGPVAALATHPDRPGRIHSALAAGGLIRSDDGGKSWTGIGSGLPAAAATALTVAAHLPDTLYLSIPADGVWQSKDSGANWEFAMDRPYLDNAEQDILTLASVNSASGMGGIWIYAGTERGLTRVPDCFCRWQDVQSGDAMEALASGTAPAPANPLPAGAPVYSLGLAPQSPEVIYAALASGVWKSSDAGVNWAKVGEAVAQCLAIDPADPNRVVAAAGGEIVRSNDGGATWSAAATL